MRLPDAFAVLLLAIATAVPSAAQAPPPEPEPVRDITQVPIAPLDGALGIPLPDEREADVERFETPELAGTLVVAGSQLVNGRLPRPIGDYFVRVNAITQRISLFEGGLVSIRLTGAGGTVQKKVLIPPGAMDVFRQELSPAELAFVRDDLIGLTNDVALLRIYDESGSHVERKFSPMAVLPRGLQRCRTIMDDLLRAIAEDRGVSNPLAGYEPGVGDRLVGTDGKAYTVTRLLRQGEIVELSCTSEPVRKYFEKKDLPRFFVGAARRPHR